MREFNFKIPPIPQGVNDEVVAVPIGSSTNRPLGVGGQGNLLGNIAKGALVVGGGLGLSALAKQIGLPESLSSYKRAVGLPGNFRANLTDEGAILRSLTGFKHIDTPIGPVTGTANITPDNIRLTGSAANIPGARSVVNLPNPLAGVFGGGGEAPSAGFENRLTRPGSERAVPTKPLMPSLAHHAERRQSSQQAPSMRGGGPGVTTRTGIDITANDTASPNRVASISAPSAPVEVSVDPIDAPAPSIARGPSIADDLRELGIEVTPDSLRGFESRAAGIPDAPAPARHSSESLNHLVQETLGRSAGSGEMTKIGAIGNLYNDQIPSTVVQELRRPLVADQHVEAGYSLDEQGPGAVNASISAAMRESVERDIANKLTALEGEAAAYPSGSTEPSYFSPAFGSVPQSAAYTEPASPPTAAQDLLQGYIQGDHPAPVVATRTFSPEESSAISNVTIHPNTDVEMAYRRDKGGKTYGFPARGGNEPAVMALAEELGRMDQYQATPRDAGHKVKRSQFKNIPDETMKGPLSGILAAHEAGGDTSPSIGGLMGTYKRLGLL